MVPHPRDLKNGDVGSDVFALKRALHVAINDPKGLRELMRSTMAVKKRWGASTSLLYKKWRTQEHLSNSGIYDKPASVLLSPYYDAYGLYLISQVKILTLCYPQPKDSTQSICQHLHPTEGIPGNWAYDFCDQGGTPVLAVEHGRISRFSGHDPSLGTQPPGDVFGWSIYLTTDEGYIYYYTHLGSRSCQVGQRVEVGDVIGAVGHWPNDPGRSHTHLGDTSPKGEADAKKRIAAVGDAIKIAA